MGKPFIPSRRDILKSGGALVVSFSFGGAAREALAEDAVAPKPVALTAVDSFVAIDSAGAVTIYSGKVDLGTGVRTALTQIAAEELDVPLSKVTIVQGDTALTPDQGPTFGSLAIQIGGVQIRNACALAKTTLIDLAAKQLGANVAELKVADGIIRTGDRHVSYGQLIGGKTFSLTLDHQKPPATKDPKTFTIVGTSIPRLDIPDKITGKFTYMQDVRVPGMLHGRVLRPPAIGAQLQSVDDASVQGIPGVVRVVREGNFLGIVAENEWAAIKASQQIKATWSAWDGLPEQTKLFEHVRASKVAKDEVTANVGNAADAMAKDGVKKISATYEFAIHTHGSIGPSCAIAEFKDGKLTSWSASQATHNLRKQLAKMFDLPPENVRCIYVEGSGCYGRNGHEDAAADAALLAKAVGLPVRVQWSRADEHGWDPKGPPTLVDLRATLDASGAVTAWDFGILHPAADAERVRGAAGGSDAQRQAVRRDHRARQHLSELEHSLQVRQHQSRLPSARDDAVPAVLDQDAGPHAEHLRERKLHGRTGGGGRRRSDRVSAEISRSGRHARGRNSQPGGRAGAVGETTLPARRAERRRRDRPRRVLLQV